MLPELLLAVYEEFRPEIILGVFVTVLILLVNRK